jgi:hypothetical protein
MLMVMERLDESGNKIFFGKALYLATNNAASKCRHKSKNQAMPGFCCACNRGCDY